MFMSRLGISPLATTADLTRIAAGDAYSDHRLLWSFFPRSDDSRSFLFRRIARGGCPAFLVVSPDAPAAPSPAWIIETKPYDPQLTGGQQLIFSLRANPVVKRRTEGEKQVRHDVVMDAKTKIQGDARVDRPTLNELSQAAGLEWLHGRANRAGFAFEENHVVCTGYRQHRVSKPGRRISFSTLDFDGVLTVTDAGLLRQALFNGIGPSKAFGCGLLLVRRAT
ncbi:MAG TPA: type I-E CRISPR-associated protein Cas6/Cse3/CasE [Thermoanaerobaculales bacterium]|nr:type I-E CRISPR-associated protein Cas6/Cse3/CasE [Thermoanaerobaculales bacterium]